MSNKDSWRTASANAWERINAPKDQRPDDDPNAAGYKLVDAVNELRHLGEVPPVTSSFASARARSNWRDRNQELTDALAEAAAGYTVAYGADPDEVLAAIQERLVADDDAELYIPSDDASDELDDDTDELDDADSDGASDELDADDDTEGSEL